MHIKKQTCFECYRRTKKWLMKFLTFIHIKGTLWHWSKCQVCAFYALPSNSNPLKTFKKELDHLVGLGVLAPQQESEWVSSSFTISKKDNRVCWISDSCQLNKGIRRKQYPLPIITDICASVLGKIILLNLAWVCNTVRLSLTTKVKTPVPSSHHLANTSTWDSQWGSNALQTLLKQ